MFPTQLDICIIHLITTVLNIVRIPRRLKATPVSFWRAYLNRASKAHIIAVVILQFKYIILLYMAVETHKKLQKFFFLDAQNKDIGRKYITDIGTGQTEKQYECAYSELYVVMRQTRAWQGKRFKIYLKKYAKTAGVGRESEQDLSSSCTCLGLDAKTSQCDSKGAGSLPVYYPAKYPMLIGWRRGWKCQSSAQ